MSHVYGRARKHSTVMYGSAQITVARSLRSFFEDDMGSISVEYSATRCFKDHIVQIAADPSEFDGVCV